MKQIVGVFSIIGPLYLGLDLFTPPDIWRTFSDAELHLLWVRLVVDVLLVMLCGYLLVFWSERFDVARRLALLGTVVAASGLAGTSLVFSVISGNINDWYGYAAYAAPGCWTYRQIHNITLCLTVICWLYLLQRQYAYQGLPGLTRRFRNAKWSVLVALGLWLLIACRVLEVGPEAGLGASVGSAAILYAGMQGWLARLGLARLEKGQAESLAEGGIEEHAISSSLAGSGRL